MKTYSPSCFRYHTIETLEPKMEFPQEFHSGRRKRLKPGPSQGETDLSESPRWVLRICQTAMLKRLGQRQCWVSDGWDLMEDGWVTIPVGLCLNRLVSGVWQGITGPHCSSSQCGLIGQISFLLLTIACLFNWPIEYWWAAPCMLGLPEFRLWPCQLQELTRHLELQRL